MSTKAGGESLPSVPERARGSALGARDHGAARRCGLVPVAARLAPSQRRAHDSAALASVQELLAAENELEELAAQERGLREGADRSLEPDAAQRLAWLIAAQGRLRARLLAARGVLEWSAAALCAWHEHDPRDLLGLPPAATAELTEEEAVRLVATERAGEAWVAEAQAGGTREDRRAAYDAYGAPSDVVEVLEEIAERMLTLPGRHLVQLRLEEGHVATNLSRMVTEVYPPLAHRGRVALALVPGVVASWLQRGRRATPARLCEHPHAAELAAGLWKASEGFDDLELLVETVEVLCDANRSEALNRSEPCSAGDHERSSVAFSPEGPCSP